MIDIELVRSNPSLVQSVCEKRGTQVDVNYLLALDSYRRKVQGDLEEVRAQSNQLAAAIATGQVENRTDAAQKGKQLKRSAIVLEGVVANIQIEYSALLMKLPNMYADDTPIGASENDNLLVSVHGRAPEFAFNPADHIALGTPRGMNFEAGSRIAGSGFPLLRGVMAKLETAVMRFVLDQAVNRGFEQVSVPLMVKHDVMQGLGFNPRHTDDGNELFPLLNDNLFMAGTAEIPLVGQFSDSIFEETQLPQRLVALTPCFRREGASGRRDAGLYRNKMFQKVELVCLSTPEASDKILADLLQFEVDIFTKLGLHFRVVRISSGDLGAPAFKKYDLEAWMLGRGNSDAWGWGELTSCSSCTDYQARRLKVRYRTAEGKIKFVHTLNGTGITTRALIPILEQNQRQDGRIVLPEVLRPYMGVDDI